MTSVGGGILIRDGRLTLIDSTVSDNSASDGGGIYNDIGTMTLTHSTVSDNSADNEDGGGDGGGIYQLYGTMTLTNSTVSDNTAHGRGGGIYADVTKEGNMTLTSSTISGNRADGGGGIQVVDRGSGIVAKATLKNTIVANNTPADCGNTAGGIASLGHNIFGDISCPPLGTGDMSGTNPLLGPLANNGGPTQTHALLTGSPAIDAVPPADLTVTDDQRGISRPQGSAGDIGSVEIVTTPTPTPTPTPIPTPTPTPRQITCCGRKATIIGTAGRDVIRGTNGRDVIHGLGGDDVIYGLDGNDIICGGSGNDKLYGENGGDRLHGGSGSDDCDWQPVRFLDSGAGS